MNTCMLIEIIHAVNAQHQFTDQNRLNPFPISVQIVQQAENLEHHLQFHHPPVRNKMSSFHRNMTLALHIKCQIRNYPFLLRNQVADLITLWYFIHKWGGGDSNCPDYSVIPWDGEVRTGKEWGDRPERQSNPYNWSWSNVLQKLRWTR